jgi:hypothetical protein
VLTDAITTVTVYFKINVDFIFNLMVRCMDCRIFNDAVSTEVEPCTL